MKKFLAALLCAMMICACIPAMAEGTVVMATNAEFAPFEYKDDAGNVIGFDADIAAEIAKDLGKELQIEDMSFDSIVAAVSSGKADMGIAAMTITEERMANVDFSEPYFIATQACVTKADSGVTDAETLQGKKIAVQQGTTGAEVAEDYTDPSNVSAFAKAVDAMTELQNGRVDAVIVDLPVAVNLMNAFADETLVEIDVEFEEEDYGIAIAKGQPELLASINATLERINTDGTIDALYAKYFGDEEE